MFYIWMEGTDSDCVNMNGLDNGTGNPTFDVAEKNTLRISWTLGENNENCGRKSSIADTNI